MELIKQIFSWLFIFIVGSLIVSFLIYPNSFNSFKYNVKSISKDVIDNTKSFKSNIPQKSVNLENDNYCEEKIVWEELKIWTDEIGDKIDLKGNKIFGRQIIVNGLSEDDSIFYKDPIWKDETEMVFEHNGFRPNFSDCNVGSNERENINYLYCRDFAYDTTIQRTSETGEILGYDNYNYIVTLVVEKEPYKEELAFNLMKGYFFYYKIIDYKCLRKALIKEG